MIEITAWTGSPSQLRERRDRHPHGPPALARLRAEQSINESTVLAASPLPSDRFNNLHRFEDGGMWCCNIVTRKLFFLLSQASRLWKCLAALEACRICSVCFRCFGSPGEALNRVRNVWNAATEARGQIFDLPGSGSLCCGFRTAANHELGGHHHHHHHHSHHRCLLDHLLDHQGHDDNQELKDLITITSIIMSHLQQHNPTTIATVITIIISTSIIVIIIE